MPKPVFNIEQYELRGVTPPVFSAAQKKRLADVLSRANGQIDWTAQLLGFNGPNYWGLSNPKADGSYDWKGLPDTMNQKRQLQTTTYGVYDKDKDYNLRPAPFNRSEIKASGDSSFHIWEAGGQTQLSPLGQGKLITYGAPEIFVGGQYIFDDQVEFLVEGKESEILSWTFFNGVEREYTRMVLNQTAGPIKVSLKGSIAEPALLIPRQWEDISDWDAPETKAQFIGLWGNKGNSFSFDAAFDALELHGFKEQEGLSLLENSTCLTLSELLGRVGLKATEWTKWNNTELGFQTGDCPVVYPLPAYQVEDNFAFYNCDECNATVSLIQTSEKVTNPCDVDGDLVAGIKEICVKYTPKTDAGYVEFPCIEFVFDPTLNDGIYPRENLCPETPGPWMTADDGIYDTDIECLIGAGQTALKCTDSVFCGFNDGEYDELVQPICNPPDDEFCTEADGGFYLAASGPPNYFDICDCDTIGCCLIDNSFYVYGEIPYQGPELANGGIYEAPPCIIYDNSDYDRAVVASDCSLDNGLIDGQPPTDRVQEGKYNRFIPGCTECVVGDDPLPVEACPVLPVRVDLTSIFEELDFLMSPTIVNSLTPLRVWKNRVLTVTDEIPSPGAIQYNPLVCDQNSGPEPADDYRYFVRLPLEYPRNGPDWNKAEAVCNNQGYFSAPPALSQTSLDPPVLRTELYDESYTDTNLPVYTIFYEEGYLTSTSQIDAQDIVQEGFVDAAITFEAAADIPFAYASIIEYDAFDSRVPYSNGNWRGNYYAFGVNSSLLSGYVINDVEDSRLELLPEQGEPVYDMSRIKRPNIEFPDDVDQAALKNYVVSYAYFVADYSASDDPVFDPSNEICWRSETLERQEFAKGNARRFKVTVGPKTPLNPQFGQGSLNAYYLNGQEAPELELVAGDLIYFNQQDPSNAGHPLRFYLDQDKTTEYTTGVQFGGVPGEEAAYTTIAVTPDTPPILYYQCENHERMGNIAIKTKVCVDKPLPTQTRYLLHSSFTALINGTQPQDLKAAEEVAANLRRAESNTTSSATRRRADFADRSLSSSGAGTTGSSVALARRADAGSRIPDPSRTAHSPGGYTY